jgi:hypothetical protein
MVDRTRGSKNVQQYLLASDLTISVSTTESLANYRRPWLHDKVRGLAQINWFTGGASYLILHDPSSAVLARTSGVGWQTNPLEA